MNKHQFFRNYHKKLIKDYGLSLNDEKVKSIRHYAILNNFNLEGMINYVSKKIDYPRYRKNNKKKLHRYRNKKHYRQLLTFLKSTDQTMINNLTKKTKFDNKH